MLGTIVIDKYRITERNDIVESLEILTVNNCQDWATAGIYCYWDYDSKEILYIGLAVDLVERFRQHNGLMKCNDSSSKYQEIDQYFNKNEYIGFSIILQSALSQPISQRQRKKHNYSFNDSDLIGALGEQGHKEIKRLEGMLLEGFRQKHGKFPLWNKMGGSKEGQKSFKERQVKLLDLLNSNEHNKYISRCSLRELSNNQTYCRYEAYLHSIRISFAPILHTINSHKEIYGIDTFEEIQQSNYFKKKLNI